MPRLKICMWGTYDLGKPRVRILERGLLENNVQIVRCHRDIWSGIEDKSQIKGFWQRLRRALAWLLAYPVLVIRYMRQPGCDVVLVPYLGHLDVLFLWPFAKYKKEPIVWDAFLSLYNTIVEDRKLLRPANPIAKLIWCWEWLACRAADLVLLDTDAHANYFVETFHLPASKVGSVFVGAEPEYFQQVKEKDEGATSVRPLVLFYGQLIPLHGVDTIVQAARLLEDEDIDWVIIGSGQEQDRIKALLADQPLSKLKWIPWVDYTELKEWIAKAGVCLGIFGNGRKASMVIPNKVFQILMYGKPLITRDSPAIRELLSGDEEGVKLIKADNPAALAAAVKERFNYPLGYNLYASVGQKITPKAIGADMVRRIVHKNLV